MRICLFSLDGAPCFFLISFLPSSLSPCSFKFFIVQKYIDSIMNILYYTPYLQYVTISYKAQCFWLKKAMSMYSGPLCMKINLFKMTKCFAHCICSYICISNICVKARCAWILKVKSKISFTQWNFDRSINITGRMMQTWSIEAKLIT